MTLKGLKAAVRERDGNRCTKCGMTAEEHMRRYGRALDVHRTTPGGGYTMGGCVTVCRACHGPLPRKRGGYQDGELSPCAKDVLDLLAGRRGRLTAPEIMAELKGRGIVWSEVTLARTLSRLVKGKALESQRRTPQGYRVPVAANPASGLAISR